MFKKLSELVEAGTIDKEVAEAIDTEISSELSTLRDEAKKYRLEKEELAKAFEEVKTSKEDMSAKLNEFDERIKRAKEEGKSEVARELEAEREKHTTLMENLQKFEQENKKLKVTNAVNEALSSFKVKPDVRQDVATLLSSTVQLAEDGTVQYGDKPLNDGIKEFFEARQSYLEPEGQPGSGAENRGGGTKAPKGNLGGSKEERLAAIKDMINK